MDKKHRLDAPNNDSLSGIEQIEDRSQLAAVYPHKHEEWEGTKLMSQDTRAAQRDQQQDTIYKSIRSWFVVIGFLIPLPYLLFSLFVSGITALGIEIKGMVLFLLGFIVMVLGFLSFKAIRAVYEIFYNHSIKATPFVVSLLTLLVLSIHPIYTITQGYFSDIHFMNMLLICGIITLMSILYSGLLLIIWTTHRLSGRVKFLSIGLIGLFIILVEIAQNFHLIVG